MLSADGYWTDTDHRLRARWRGQKTIHGQFLAEELGAIRFSPDEWMEYLGVNLWDENARARIEALQWKLARDLLRICLAADNEESLWPLDADPDVDATLADDDVRALWREGWRHRLASFDALFAADRPRRAVDAISQEDTF